MKFLDLVFAVFIALSACRSQAGDVVAADAGPTPTGEFRLVGVLPGHSCEVWAVRDRDWRAPVGYRYVVVCEPHGGTNGVANVAISQ